MITHINVYIVKVNLKSSKYCPDDQAGLYYVGCAPGNPLVRDIQKAKFYNSFDSAEKSAKSQVKFSGEDTFIETYSTTKIKEIQILEN